MSDEQFHTPDSSTSLENGPFGQKGRESLARRGRRRDDRNKNTLIWRELALIAALASVTLAFNLDLGSPRGDRDVAVRKNDDIHLREVRVTPPEPPAPERRSEPAPEVPKEMPREEVPDEEVVEEPEMTDEPRPEPVKTPPVKVSLAPEPSPTPSSRPNPEPRANKVYSQNTVDRNAQMKGPIEVEYPRSARRAGIEGRVILQFVVDESGRPQDIQVLRSPDDLLSKAAVAALKKKSFEPAMQSGQPVKMRMSQPINFSLQR